MTVRTVVPARARGRLSAPPSKSYTHRAFVAAYLAGQPCRVIDPLESDDTRATREGLRALGARLRRTRTGWTLSPPAPTRSHRIRTVNCGESGTTLRLLAAVAARDARPTRLVGARRLAARPTGELYSALRRLGANVTVTSRRRGLPCEVRGPIHAGAIKIRGDVSSQYTSAMLLVLPTLAGPSAVRVRGSRVSRPYVAATLAVLRDRGIRIRSTSTGYQIPGGQTYRAGRIRVPGDASSAAYLWAAAGVTGGSVEVTGVPPGPPQADLAILQILRRMGARVERTPRGICVSGRVTRPVDIDLSDFPDLFPLVAVLAALVPFRRSRLRGAPHLAHKESNRRAGAVQLARGVGARVSASQSSVNIVGTSSPRPLHLTGATDHRLVMSAAVAALAATGPSRIGRAEAVAKSFPGFWDALARLTSPEDRR